MLQRSSFLNFRLWKTSRASTWKRPNQKPPTKKDHRWFRLIYCFGQLFGIWNLFSSVVDSWHWTEGTFDHDGSLWTSLHLFTAHLRGGIFKCFFVKKKKHVYAFRWSKKTLEFFGSSYYDKIATVMDRQNPQGNSKYLNSKHLFWTLPLWSPMQNRPEAPADIMMVKKV